MSVPTEYTTAKNRLTSFRDQILAELVGGRIKASLDASHAGMQKYGKTIQTLSSVPYMFGEVQRKAVALKLKGLDVGAGKIRNVRADFTLPEVDYPITYPFNVPRRKLPQVDVFAYTPITNVDFLDFGNIANLKSVIILQFPNNTFENQPTAENALYDFYEIVPQYRARGERYLSGVDPYYPNATRIRGEFMYCNCRLCKKGVVEWHVYGLFLYLDGELRTDTQHHSNIAVMVAMYRSIDSPNGWLNVAGAKAAVTSGRLWGAGKYADALRGWQIIANMGDPVEDYDYTWYNHFDIALSVNDPIMGTTDPPPSTYTKKAMDEWTITAMPNTGYTVDKWTVGGITYQVGGTTYKHYCWDTLPVVCVFKPV